MSGNRTISQRHKLSIIRLRKERVKELKTINNRPDHRIVI
jgi:hypothetical protein